MSSANKENSDPSSLLVYIYAFLMLSIGVGLGFFYLMAFPMEVYPNLKERTEALEGREVLAPTPGNDYYIAGPNSLTRSWESKRKQLIDGSVKTITVSPGEINAWFSAKFRSSAASTKEEAENLMIVPSVPNIGISEDGTTYLNLPAQISGFGLDDEYVFSAKVRYRSGAPAMLVIDELQINSAVVPLPGMLGDRLVSGLMKAFSSAEEYGIVNEAWSRVESVEIANGAFVLTLATL